MVIIKYYYYYHKHCACDFNFSMIGRYKCVPTLLNNLYFIKYTLPIHMVIEVNIQTT